VNRSRKRRGPGRIGGVVVLVTLTVLGASLLAGGETRGQESSTGLSELTVPGPLPVYAARRAAATVFEELSMYSDTHTEALRLVEHLAAVARFQAYFDRPRHPPVLETVTEQQPVQSLRRRYQLREAELEALNPGVDLQALQPGDQLVVWRYDPATPGRSRNRANNGRLQDGELFPPGAGWVVADFSRAYGAEQTIDALVFGMRAVMARHPGGQELLVADLSPAGGGRFRPHLSHQSGRDVDVTYYRRTSESPTFTRCRTEELDEKRNWTFLRAQLTQHDVTYVFMQRALQIRLYEYALSIGEHPGWVASVFQYGPDGHRNNRGIIRVSPGHHDHMHIRYGCSSADIRCRDSG
jgi:hypothetical protein